MDVPMGMKSLKYKNYCAGQIEQGLAMGLHLSNFAKEDHGTMAVFIELWSSTLVQRVWVSTKALLGGLRIKVQQRWRQPPLIKPRCRLWAL